ncbi:hypothetical protein KCU93_g3756, partial [Aureobasidium melanogenum]
MNSRASVIRIFRSSQVSKHDASCRISPWPFRHCRPAAFVRFWSIANRTSSTTPARKLDLADLTVRSEVKDPSEIFRTHLAEGTLTRPLAVSCLQDIIRSSSGSGIGEAAIKWLWDEHDSIEFPNDTPLVDAIALLLVRDGKEKLMWDWMNQKSRRPATLSNRDRHVWRVSAFRGLVEAKARLATDGSLDAALETYFRGTNVPYFLYTTSAANFCHAQLVRLTKLGYMPSHAKHVHKDVRNRPLFPNTDLKLWDAFYEETGKRPEIYREKYQAEMQLHHPRHPDPMPLFNWWYKVQDTPNDPLHHVKSKAAMISLVKSSKILQISLHQSGQQMEAEWLKKFTRKKFPFNKNYWGSSPRERLNHDPPLTEEQKRVLTLRKRYVCKQVALSSDASVDR